MILHRPRSPHGLLNTAHLESLCERVTIDGRAMALIHVYADAPSYGWVDADGEGVACVDDAARAALVFLECHDRFRDAASLEQARLLLEFVLYLQTDEGTFCNFLHDRVGTVNRCGITSCDGWNWWTARALWALARGIRTFERRDPDYARRLRTHYLAAEASLWRAWRERDQAFVADAADMSSVIMLGLAEYHESLPSRRTRMLLERLGEAVAAHVYGSAHEYPFGLHPDVAEVPSPWHLWGSHQVHALAVAGRVLARPDFVASARREADSFYSHMLAGEWIAHFGLAPSVDEQIAYGTSVCTSGLAALASATGEPVYSRLAGLAASWLMGNNRARTPMYDPQTGRGYDGIDGVDAPLVNLNAGAESTIEALWTLLQVLEDPLARRYVSARREGVREDEPPWRIVAADTGRARAGAPSTSRPAWLESVGREQQACMRLASGEGLELRFRVPCEGEYYLYLGHAPAPGSPASLACRVDGGRSLVPAVVRKAPAPSGSPWLALLTSSPAWLDAGEHAVAIESRQGTSDVCLLMAQPAEEARTLSLPDGTGLEVWHSLRDGTTIVREEPSSARPEPSSVSDLRRIGRR